MAKLCISLRNALWRSLIFMALALSLSSCASVGGPSLQPQVNSLVAAGNAKAAEDKIMAQKADYGKGNYVLYYLDRALVLQLNADFSSSVESLEKAKLRQDELYTQSLTQEAATWLINDNMAPYRAPAYERVLMNVFQAFNYLQMDNFEEALVEARDLDARFPVVPDLYAQNTHRFEDNGFARLLTGVLYEAAGGREDLNDALIAYKQALTVYDAYYGGRYVPFVLQQNLLRLAAKFHDPDLQDHRTRFSDVTVAPDRSDMATVYVLHAIGFSPVRVSEMIPVPLEDGIVSSIAFPRYVRRPYAVRASRVLLQGPSGETVGADTELGADIEDLAERDLAAFKVWALAKGVLRPTLKYLVERNQKEAIEKHHGALAADVFGFLSSIYNLYTERADVRSWQALPGQVRVARLQVPAGSYQVNIEDLDTAGGVVSIENKGEAILKPGETYVFIRRSLQ